MDAMKLLAALLVVTSASMCHGFCIYNSCNTTIAAIQLPIQGASFKGNIDPGTSSKPSSSCCAYNDCGQYSPETGRCGKAQFCMIKGSVDTGAVTAAAILSKIDDALIKSFDFIPGIGALGAANDAAKNELSNFGLQCDAVVSSFNGGIVECLDNGSGSAFYGAWDGSNATPPPGTANC